MRKIALLALLLVFNSGFATAKEATGVIDEIRLCSPYSHDNGGWYRVLFFKVQGDWFSAIVDYFSPTPADFDRPIDASFIMMAFSQEIIVTVKASAPWGKPYSDCGIAEGFVFDNARGDYLSIKR